MHSMVTLAKHLMVIQILRGLVGERVDWFLDELVEVMEQRTGKHVSVPTLWRSLEFCGFSRKKVDTYM